MEVKVDGIGTFWLNEKHIEEKLDPKHFPVITTNMTQYTKSADMN